MEAGRNAMDVLVEAQRTVSRPSLQNGCWCRGTSVCRLSEPTFDRVRRHTVRRSFFWTRTVRKTAFLVNESQHVRSRDEVPAWINFAAGIIATLVTRTVLIPLDTIKTNLQSTLGTQLRGMPWHARVAYVTRNVVQRHGVLGLWRGLPVSVLGNAPAQAVYMATYEAFKAGLRVAEPSGDQVRRSTPRTLVRVALAAALADTVASLVRVPPEVVKQQVQTGQFRNASSALCALAKQPLHRGGLYRGFWAQVMRDVPFAVALFVVYESLNEIVRQRRIQARSDSRDQQQTPAAAEMLNRKPVWTGSVAGTVAALCTMPMDIARTRLMARPYGEYTGVWQAVLRIAREEGFMTLWSGTWLRILYKMPSSTLFLASFDWSRSALLRLQRAFLHGSYKATRHRPFQ